jgi:FkbM family methyltransferase
VPLFFGKKMKVVTGEIVSSNLIVFGYTEIALTGLMIQNLNKGDCFVDVGSHFGYEAMLAIELVRDGGYIYSFESNPNSFKIAAKNVRGKNVNVYNSAVGSYDGTAMMLNNDIRNSAFNSVVSGQSTGNTIEVQMSTLDDTLRIRARQLNFVKCDVEGSEIDVLKGALNIISKINRL